MRLPYEFSTTPSWKVVLMMMMSPLIAIVIGFVSTTANPIMIGLAVGAVFGVGLLMQPKIAFWIAVVGVFAINGPISQFLPDLVKISWLFSVLGFLLMMLSVTERIVATTPNPAPLLFYSAVALVAYSLASSFAMSPSVGEVFAGFKRYYQMWGLFFALAVLPFTFKDMLWLRRFMTFVVFAQLPFAAYQLIVWVPLRVGMGRGVVPIDAVNGMFEGDFYGGGASSVMAFVLVLAVAYLIKLWRVGRLGTFPFLILLPLAAAPLFMGETKIVVVTLPVAILVALRQELMAKAFTGLLIIVSTLAVTLLLGYLYTVMMLPPGKTFDDQIAQTIAYNFGSAPYSEAAALNRTTVMTFWWGQQSWSDPIAAMFGYGLGASYSDPLALVVGRLAQRYPGMGIEGTSASTVLWELGAVGFVLYLVVFYAGWRYARRAVARHRGTHFGVLMCVVEAGAVLNFIYFFYTAGHVLLLSQGAVHALLLGLAVLGCRLRPATPPKRPRVSPLGQAGASPWPTPVRAAEPSIRPYG